jgi:hypothetical protein
MGKYLAEGALGRAIDFFLDTLSDAEKACIGPDRVEGLTDKTHAIAERLEALLLEVRSLAGASDEERILLYGLLKQLPVIVFEPLNYAFVGRVVIPLENVLDLLINLDSYTGSGPVRKGQSPGTVELLSVSEQPEIVEAALGLTDADEPGAESAANQDTGSADTVLVVEALAEDDVEDSALRGGISEDDLAGEALAETALPEQDELDKAALVEQTPEPIDLVGSAVAATAPRETEPGGGDHHNDLPVERGAESVDLVSRVFGRATPRENARDRESLGVVPGEDQPETEPEDTERDDAALTELRLEDRALSEKDLEDRDLDEDDLEEDDLGEDISDPENPALAQGVIDIAGIGPTYAALLRLRAGIHTIQDLLQRGATSEQRTEIATKTGLSERLVARWVRRADLMRIDGIGEEYGELLDYGGLESVAELARSNAQRLYERLRMANAGRNLVQRLPSLDDIRLWIDQARNLD